MCNLHTLQEIDPSRTLTIRRSFAREMSKRFLTIRSLIRKAIVAEDVFGLIETPVIQVTANQTPGFRRYQFGSSAQKVSQFMAWFRGQVQNHILQVTTIEQVGTSVNAAWTNQYILNSYKKGIQRARQQLRQAKKGVPAIELTGGIEASINVPIHADRLGLLYARTFSDLKGVTDAMDTQISRVLAQGIADGVNPRVLANMLTKTIKGGGGELGITDILGRYIPAERRAEMIARTEIIRAHAEAQLKEFENWKVEGVSLRAEWSTAGFNVCPICEAEASKPPRPIREAYGLIPAHVNCYQKDTEVYTNKGWKLFSELDKTEKFWSISENDFTPEWISAKNYIEYKFNGELISYQNKTTDIIVTPNHNMFCEGRKTKNKKWQFIEAKDLPKWDYNFYRGVEWIGTNPNYIDVNGLKIETELFCKFLAYYLADGSTTKRSENHYQLKISQETHLDLMYDELKELPVKVNLGQKAIYISDIRLTKYTNQFGKCNEKYIPDIIKSLSPRLIKIFLIAYSITDGHTKKGKKWKGGKFKDQITFFSTSKRISDDLGELIMKAGGRPSFKIRDERGKHQFKNGIYDINHVCYLITWCNHIKTSISTMNIKKIPYNDYVYCVELEKNHTLLVRRNGKVVWSGNCRCIWIPV